MPSRSGDASDLNAQTDESRSRFSLSTSHGVTLGNFRIAGGGCERTESTQPEPPPQEDDHE